MVLAVNEVFFFITIMDTLIKADEKSLGAADWNYIEALPERAAWYGFDPEFGSCMARHIRRVAKHGLPRGVPKPSFDLWFRPMLKKRRAPKQRCVPNPLVIAMYRQKYPVRLIVLTCGVTRANVKKMIADYKLSHGRFN